MMQEIWKDIKGYEGLYQVSNFGKIKSLAKQVGFCFRSEKILKNNIDTYGYEYVILSKANKTKPFLVHRIVASHFIENVNNKEEVNHIDGNKKNNIVTNLEWCTSTENKKHAISNNLFKPKFNKSYNAIEQYDKEGNLIKIWEKASLIQKKLQFSSGRIHNCCKGKHKTAYGFIWKYNKGSIQN